jgi:hypothetical protein
MNELDKYNTKLKEITEIYEFLTEGKPSPDDEIEAREKLIDLFSLLQDLSSLPEQKEQINYVLRELRAWDTLDLWFLETSIPHNIELFLEIPRKESLDENSYDISEDVADIEKPSVDISEIVDQVSTKFMGEIDNLRDTIEKLKIELEKKEEAIKAITQKKSVQKITPKRDVKLPPPIIKIPVIKKMVAQNDHELTSDEGANKSESFKDTSGKESPEIQNTQKEIKRLTPIPSKESVSQDESKTIKPTTPVSTIIVENASEIPIIAQKKRVQTVIDEEDMSETTKTKPEQLSTIPFSAEKPKITSVKIEEIETETLRSSGSDLFSVLSSVGESSIKSKAGSTKPASEIFSVTKTSKEKITEDIELVNKEEVASSFVDLNTRTTMNAREKSSTEEEDLPTDKDSLYQELIALEGKRYAVEKAFKELEKSYTKGTVADMQYKNQAEQTQSKLKHITTRINKIRRLITSL